MYPAKIAVNDLGTLVAISVICRTKDGAVCTDDSDKVKYITLYLTPDEANDLMIRLGIYM